MKKIKFDPKTMKTIVYDDTHKIGRTELRPKTENNDNCKNNNNPFGYNLPTPKGE